MTAVESPVLRKLRWQRVEALSQLHEAMGLVGESLRIVNDLDLAIVDLDPTWSPRNPRVEILAALQPQPLQPLPSPSEGDPKE